MRDKQYFKQEDQAIFDAVWNWVKDHSDLKPDGQLFVKAHIKSKDSFVQSIRFRMKGGYRDLLDKDGIMQQRREEHLKKAEMNNVLARVERENKRLLKRKTLKGKLGFLLEKLVK